MWVLIQSVQLVRVGAVMVLGGLEVLWVRQLRLQSKAATCCSPLKAFLRLSVRASYL
jgi:hypothetical protein